MRKNKRKKKGFTLIEAVAGMAMFAIVATVIMNMIIDVNKYNAMNKNQVDTYAMSKTFNETIKSVRPIKIKDKLPDWENTDEAVAPGSSKYYFIAINSVEDLIKVVKEDFLDKNENGIEGVNYKLKEGVLEREDIEELCKSYGIGYKYGIKIQVQKKQQEKVYLFDTITMDIDKGPITNTNRQFAISSEV